MTSVDFGTANGVCLTYDALGRMVEQGKGSNCTTSYAQIVYSPNGAKLGIMNGQTLTKAFVGLASGQAVYTSSGLAYYRHQDWLGTSRLATTPTRTMYYDTAYAPFGENYLGAVGSSQNPLKTSLKFDHASSEKSRFFAEWLYSPVPYRNYRVPWTGASFGQKTKPTPVKTVTTQAKKTTANVLPMRAGSSARSFAT